MAAPSAMVPVSDELLALSAIYGDELTLHPPPPLSFTLRLCPTLSLTVTLSDAYPSNPPSFTLQRLADSSFSDAEVEAVRGRGEAVVRESEGEEGYCYQLIEAMREEATDIEERRRRAEASALRPPAADCRTAHSTITLPDDNEDEWEAEYEHDAPEDAAEEWQRRKLARLSLQPATPATEQVSPLTSGPPLTVQRSVFIAHVAPLLSPAALPPLLSHIHSHPKLSRATHNMYAYRISTPSYTQSGCDDDGEDRAGGRLLHLLEAMGVVNVFVCVSRWYGGVKLGSERFRVINNVARELLEREGYQGERRGEATARAKGRKGEK